MIERLSRSEPLRVILVTGASREAASALAAGLRANPRRPRLHCLSASGDRPGCLQEVFDGLDTVQFHGDPAVAAAEFTTEWEVARRHVSHGSGFGTETLSRTLDRLRAERSRATVGSGAIERIKALEEVDNFDLVIIDGSDFTASAEFTRLRGARIVLLGGTDTLKGSQVRESLRNDLEYELLAESSRSGGYALFRRRDADALPIHFFTIVLNGEPFIRYHERLFASLPFRWHWHIVEGVASLSHDTAWSVGSGGRVPESLHDKGRSNDGTSAWLDELAARYPDRVTLYRKPPGVFWDGKREMVNAPLDSIKEECLLWQIDADEVWTAGAIRDVRSMFLAEPGRTAAYYWCDFFVTPNHVISTRRNYGQNPDHEWLRTWRFTPGMRWAAHEPPTLVDPKGRDIGRMDPFLHDETEEAGAIFQHFAYVTEAQVKFKEIYYGYAGALEHWRRLRDEVTGPVPARDHLPWVNDATVIDSAAERGVVPIAVEEGGVWRFRPPAEVTALRAARTFEHPRIVIDGVFFQNLNSGIARVWVALFEAWARSGFARHIVLLDRDGTAPRLPGLHLRTIRSRDKDAAGADSLYLERICREEGADLFVSTYYTTPTATPSVFFGHDMIPEVLGLPLDDETWREKHRAIQHACAHIMVSRNSARDLERLMPCVPPGSTCVALNGVSPVFRPAGRPEIEAFRRRHKLTRPYILTVGERCGYQGYKNAFLLFRAFGLGAAATAGLDIVCVGGAAEIEPVLRALAPEARAVRLALDDEDLRLAYAGAEAFAYPSRYEGFGIPVLEAMACGCPVITCRNSSLPEVAGEAALFVGEDDAEGLVAAIAEARDPTRRAALVAAGQEQANGFSFDAMAATVADHLLATAAKLGEGSLPRPLPVWHDLRTTLAGGGMSGVGHEEVPAWELRRRLEQSERNLKALRGDLESMTNSPFWRLRRLTLAVLKRLGVRWRR